MTAKPETAFVYTFPTTIEESPETGISMKWSVAGSPFEQRHVLSMNDALSTVRFYPSILSVDECQRVIAMGEAQPRAAGRVELGDEAYRVSHIAWLDFQTQNEWLFHKLGYFFQNAASYYGFEVTGLTDALQYTMYAEDQFFNWHADIGQGTTSARKLSMTVQLSADDDYIGGELEFLNANSQKGQGGATIFPSFMAHRVAPVTLGVRRSLVAWAAGPAFR